MADDLVELDTPFSGEPLTYGKTMTQRLGFATAKQRIESIMSAGLTLQRAREEMYDGTYGDHSSDIYGNDNYTVSVDKLDDAGAFDGVANIPYGDKIDFADVQLYTAKQREAKVKKMLQVKANAKENARKMAEETASNGVSSVNTNPVVE